MVCGAASGDSEEHRLKAEPATPAKKPGFSTVSLRLSFCPLLSALHSYVPKQQQGEEVSVCLWLHRTLHSLETENVAFNKKKKKILLPSSKFFYDSPKETPVDS